MNIINQPGGNPVFPSKVSGTQDSTEHVQLSLSLPATNPPKTSQSSLSKRTSCSVTRGGSRQAQHVIKAYSVAPKTTTESGVMNYPNSSISSFSNHLKSEEHFSYLDHPLRRIGNAENHKLGIQSFNPSLVVSSLLENDKLTAIDDMEVESYKLSSQPNAVLRVSVSSAVELNSKQIDLITKKMQKLTGFRRLKIENTIDPSLIAGFVIDYSSDGSEAIDLSVKGMLAMLAARLESSDKTNSHIEKWNYPS